MEVLITLLAERYERVSLMIRPNQAKRGDSGDGPKRELSSSFKGMSFSSIHIGHELTQPPKHRQNRHNTLLVTAFLR